MAGRWTRLPPAPFGAWYAVAAWTGTSLLVVDPQSGRTAEWRERSNRWRERRPAPFAFATFGSHALWADGILIVLADRDDELVPIAFDPRRDEWTPLAPAPIEPIAAAVWTGEVVVAATLSGAAAAYDPAQDCWMPLPDVPGAGAVVGVLWTGERVLADTRTPLEAVGTDRQVEVAQLDPDSLTWTAGPAAPFAIGHNHEATWSNGAVVYWSWDKPSADEGSNGLYDPAAGTWRELEWDCRTTASETLVAEQLLVASDGRRALDPATGTCYRMPAPPRRLLGRSVTIWTGEKLISWSGTRTEDGPPVRGGQIFIPELP